MTPLGMFITIGILGILIAFCLVYLHFSNKKIQNNNINIQDNKLATKKKIVNNNYLLPLPTVFTKKYSDETLNDNFEKEFNLDSYKLPDEFVDFCNSNKIYRLGEDPRYASDLYPLKFTKIIESAKHSIMWSDVFCIPPHCIPFCYDESGGHVFYCLDYNLCGKQGSPRIISVDNEFIDFDDYKNVREYNFKEKIIAESFGEFLKLIEEVKK